jgi:hypothetical protein
MAFGGWIPPISDVCLLAPAQSAQFPHSSVFVCPVRNCGNGKASRINAPDRSNLSGRAKFPEDDQELDMLAVPGVCLFNVYGQGTCACRSLTSGDDATSQVIQS